MAGSTPTESARLNDPALPKFQPVLQHLGNVTASAASKSEAYLPKGVSETDEEKEKHWFIGSIDQGTTSSRFLIFNGEGNPIASHQLEFKNKYPEPGSAPESIYLAFVTLLTVSFQVA